MAAIKLYVCVLMALVTGNLVRAEEAPADDAIERRFPFSLAFDFLTSLIGRRELGLGDASSNSEASNDPEHQQRLFAPSLVNCNYTAQVLAASAVHRPSAAIVIIWDWCAPAAASCLTVTRGAALSFVEILATTMLIATVVPAIPLVPATVPLTPTLLNLVKYNIRCRYLVRVLHNYLKQYIINS